MLTETESSAEWLKVSILSLFYGQCYFAWEITIGSLGCAAVSLTKKRFHQVTLKQRLFLWNSIYWITIQDMTHSRQHITATVRTSYYYPLTEVTDGTGLTAVSDYFWTFCLDCQTSSLTLRECSEWTHWLTVLTVIDEPKHQALTCYITFLWCRVNYPKNPVPVKKSNSPYTHFKLFIKTGLVTKYSQDMALEYNPQRVFCS